MVTVSSGKPARSLPQEPGAVFPSMLNENVKSVTRVFEILECFERERHPLNATSIGRALNYPQSSTQALLKTMVNLGYLTYDSRVRAYFPTPKILLTTRWLLDTPMANSGLLDALDDLQKMTGETATLSSYRDMDMQVVQLTAGSHPIALNLQPGDRLPLFTSAVGLAFLADQTPDVVERLIKRARKLAARTKAPAIKADAVKDAVDAVRSRGAAVGYGLVLDGVGAVAAAIRCPISGAPYVLGAGGPASRIAKQERDIVKALRSIVSRQS